MTRNAHQSKILKIELEAFRLRCAAQLVNADVMRESADVGAQRNSVSGHCSARLGLIRLAIRKIGLSLIHI